MRISMTVLTFAATLAVVSAQSPAPQQFTQDEYAEYWLLAPESGSFKTVYEVAVTTPGATTFLDSLLKLTEDLIRCILFKRE